MALSVVNVYKWSMRPLRVEYVRTVALRLTSITETCHSPPWSSPDLYGSVVSLSESHDRGPDLLV